MHDQLAWSRTHTTRSPVHVSCSHMAQIHRSVHLVHSTDRCGSPMSVNSTSTCGCWCTCAHAPARATIHAHWAPAQSRVMHPSTNGPQHACKSAFQKSEVLSSHQRQSAIHATVEANGFSSPGPQDEQAQLVDERELLVQRVFEVSYLDLGQLPLGEVKNLLAEQFEDGHAVLAQRLARLGGAHDVWHKVGPLVWPLLQGQGGIAMQGDRQIMNSCQTPSTCGTKLGHLL